MLVHRCSAALLRNLHCKNVSEGIDDTLATGLEELGSVPQLTREHLVSGSQNMNDPNVFLTRPKYPYCCVAEDGIQSTSSVGFELMNAR